MVGSPGICPFERKIRFDFTLCRRPRTLARRRTVFTTQLQWYFAKNRYRRRKVGSFSSPEFPVCFPTVLCIAISSGTRIGTFHTIYRHNDLSTMVDFRMGRLQRLVGCLLGLLSSSWLVGQSSVTTVALDSVTVEAFRIPKRSDRLPFSVSQVRYTDTQDQRQQLTLADYLLDFPGVFALNANNYAQDLRIAIRGFWSTVSLWDSRH